MAGASMKDGPGKKADSEHLVLVGRKGHAGIE
jgi:hypothetical protein